MTTYENIQTSHGTGSAQFYELETGNFWAVFHNGSLVEVTEVTEENVLISTLFHAA